MLIECLSNKSNAVGIKKIFFSTEIGDRWYSKGSFRKKKSIILCFPSNISNYIKRK